MGRYRTLADIEIAVPKGATKLLLTAGKWCNDDILITALSDDAVNSVETVATDPSAFNFTLDPGTSKRLLTAGKYCDRNIMVTANWILPSGYKQIEYIRTTGSAYIFMDFLPNSNTNLKITFSTTSSNRCIIGCYERWGPLNAYSIWAHAVAFGNEKLLNINLYKDGEKHTIEITNGTYYLDGEEFFRYTGEYFEAPVPLGVFALNRNGSVYEINNDMNIYNLEIDGIKYPLCKNSDEEIGIYNPISKKFLTNRGSKQFIAGPEIM